MSSFILKIIAIVAMLFDHTGYIIFEKFTFMNYVGRLAFPIFAFFISEGYSHTKNLKKYFLRLFIFALISQIPYMLFISSFSDQYLKLNTLFTLILGLCGIIIYEKSNYKFLGLIAVAILSIIAQVLHFDYGWFGVLIIFIFHRFKNKKFYMNLLFIITAFINYMFSYIFTLQIEYIIIIVFCCLSLIPINLYNGKKGKNTKYALYIFYPIHLILLYFLSFLI